MTAQVLRRGMSRAIEARSVKHRGEKRRFCFGWPRPDSRIAAGAFWLGRLSPTPGRAGKRVLRAGRGDGFCDLSHGHAGNNPRCAEIDHLEPANETPASF